MSGPIGTIPQGLLSLLYLKQTGKNPPLLLDEVAPNLEMAPFYLNRIMQGTFQLFNGLPATGAIVTGGNGFNLITVGGVQVQVPDEEMWFIDQAGLTTAANIAAADTVTAGLAIVGQGSELICPVYADVITARARSWITPPISRPFFIGPGTQFKIFVTDVLSAGGITFNLQMRAARLPI